MRHPFNPEISATIKPIAFPSGLLTCSVFLTLLCLVILSAFTQTSYRFLERLIQRDVEITQKAEQIIYYDEVLTMSARIATIPSQDTATWHKRYKEYELLLDDDIQNIVSLSGNLDYDVSPISQTDSANQKLITMEEEAFSLSYKGKFKEARAILFSPQYSENKKIYSTSIIKVVSNIRTRMQKLIKEAQQNLLHIKVASLTSGMLLVIMWFYTIIHIRRWHIQTRHAFINACESQRQLEESSQKLQAKNYELARFNFIVAHDLKESLRSIFSFSQLASNETNDKNTKNYLTRIQNSCRSMRSLIEDLLSYAKLDKSQIIKTRISVYEIVVSLRDESLNELVTSRNAEIICYDLPDLYTDRIRLTQVLANLITNGITYNCSPTPTINIYSEIKNNAQIIYIKDNGIGIDKEYSETIFELFTRLNDKRVYNGSGLGLSICKKNMESLGGDIWLEESEKDGSIFALEFPEAIAQKSSAASNITSAKQSAKEPA